jgi:benzylsuccinate CoA-transferase BbsF subunit
MLKHFDVVAENFRTGVMDKWGIGYEDLKKIKPDIIFISGSGFGRTGPNKEVPAYAPIVGGFSGYAFENGYPDGEPAEPGCRGWTDTIAAEQGSFAILAALYHRNMTGEGQYLDLSMTESELAFAPESMIDYSMNKRTHGRMGNLDQSMAPHNAYRCKGDDKWVAIAVSDDQEWAGLCKTMKNPKWTKDAKFGDALSRWQNRDEMDRLIENWTTRQDHIEAMKLLQKNGVTAGASLNMEEVCENEQLKERGYLVDIEYRDKSTIRRLAFPWKLSESGRGVYTAPPEVGDQNNYIFKELMGMSDEEIKKLVDEKVIY